MVTGIFILALSVLMLAFMENMELIQHKIEINQITRRYLLRMETEGCLTEEDRDRILYELQAAGVSNVDLGATTIEPPGYGEGITLEVKGMLNGEVEFKEKRVSTAKN